MTLIACSIILGLCLGFISFYFQEIFWSGAFTLGVASFFLLRTLPAFTFVIASSVSPTGQSEGWVRDFFNMCREIFALLPDTAQLSLGLLSVCLIVGRVLTWAHYTAFPDHALAHTEAEKSAKTVEKFSLKRPRL